MRYVILALALLFAIPAHADTFSFTITGAVQAGGTITTGPDEDLMLRPDPNSDENLYTQVIGMTGEFNGIPITFDPNSGGILQIADGQGPMQPLLVNLGQGLLFFAGDQYLIFENDLPGPDGFSDPIVDLTNQQGDVTGPTTLTIVQTPEPSSLLLLLSSLPLIYCGRKRHSPGLSVN
jgi:hypothetical protein